jgi:hypothetical protein
MNALENRPLEMFARVREFGAARAADFPAGTLGQELFSALAQVIPNLEAHAVKAEERLRNTRK